MRLQRAFFPIAALIIAIIGAVVLFRMDFGPKNEVQRGALNMITETAVDRAGATTMPTEPRTRP